MARALLRRESLLTLVLSALLALSGLQPLPGWHPAYWLLAGALALVALAGGHLRSPAGNARAFAASLDLRRIRNETSRERLRTALEYHAAMRALVDLHRGALRSSLQQTLGDVEDWIGHMLSLARHIDAWEQNDLVARDLHAVPRRIEQARTRLEREQDPDLRSELQRQLDQLQQQLDNLNATASSGKRAALRLESTLSALGTVHAQMTLLGTRRLDNSAAQQLRQEIRDETGALQDTIEALDEVQARSARLQ